VDLVRALPLPALPKIVWERSAHVSALAVLYQNQPGNTERGQYMYDDDCEFHPEPVYVLVY
jgi:hypothetical protein